MLRRAVSLIDVPCNLLSSYHMLESATLSDRVLSCRANVVRCSFKTAMFMWELIAPMMKSAEEDDEETQISNDDMYSSKNGQTCIHEPSLTVLQPPPSKQRESVCNGILKVTEQEYNPRSLMEHEAGDESTENCHEGMHRNRSISIDQISCVVEI